MNTISKVAIGAFSSLLVVYGIAKYNQTPEDLAAYDAGQKRVAEVKAKEQKAALEVKANSELAKSQSKKTEAESGLRSSLAISFLSALKKSLNDPESLRVEWVGVNENATVVCIEYRAKNGFGGYVRDYAVMVKGKVSQSHSVWNNNCTKKMYDYTYLKHIN